MRINVLKGRIILRRGFVDSIKRFRDRHAVAVHTTIGALAGWFLLHPLVMVLTQLMHVHQAEGRLHVHGGAELLAALATSFQPIMIPWALVFSMMAATSSFYYVVRTGKLSKRVELQSSELEKAEKIFRDLVRTTTLNSADSYRTLVETSSDCIAYLDTDGNFLYMNPAGLKLHNVRGAQATGIHCTKLVKPLYEDLIRANFQKAKEGTPSRFDYQSETPTNRWFESCFTPIRDTSGTVVGIVQTSKNVTEIKQIHEALRRSEERYRTVVEKSPDAVMLLDFNHKFLMVNGQAASMHGYRSPEEMVSVARNALALVAPEDSKRCQEILENVITSGQVKNIELLLMKKDGTVFPALFSALLDDDADGDRQSIVCQYRDMTQRKEAEERMKDVAREWSNTFDSISDAIFLHDNELNIVRVNRAMTDSLQVRPAEIIGEKCYKMIYGKTRACTSCPFDETKRLRKPYTEEIHGPNGAPLLVTTSPIINEEGEVTGAVHVGRDMTEQKRSEETLKHTVEKLGRTLGQVVDALASLVDKRDPYTAGHQKRVAALGAAIAREMNLPNDEIEGVRVAGLVHDIGKVNVPAEILSKPSRLNAIEFEMIKVHPQVAHEILEVVEFPWPVAEAVHQHHERIDGSGYPQSLTSSSIILEAKILGVSDVVEAMAAHRPYRPALGTKRALEEITKGQGILYDSEVVAACLRIFKTRKFRFE